MYVRYREEINVTGYYKSQYLRTMEGLIERREQETLNKRSHYCRDIMKDKQKYREKLAEVLGWPLTEKRTNTPVQVVAQRIATEDNYIVERMQFTVLDEFVMTGLLIRYSDDTVRPFVIAQHGGEGTPELVSGLYDSTGNYNDMVERLLTNGANVFAPQLLLWAKNKYKQEYDREVLDARLKNVGSSVTALEVFALMRVLDYFEKQKWVGHIGMVGLSYGGFYTQFMAALDTRIKAAISCSYFCDAQHRVQSDMNWSDLAQYFGEAELACLVHPRKLFLEMGQEDELFDYRKSALEYERICELSKDENDDWLEFKVFHGNHEFYKEDDHIRMLIKYLRNDSQTSEHSKRRLKIYDKGY